MTNKKPSYKFKKSPQNLDEQKSKGQINRSINQNIISHIRTNLQDRNIIEKTFDVIENEIKNGNLKNAIELIKLAKETEKQELSLKTNNEAVRTVFITKEQVEAVNKHIKEVINS